MSSTGQAPCCQAAAQENGTAEQTVAYLETLRVQLQIQLTEAMAAGDEEGVAALIDLLLDNEVDIGYASGRADGSAVPLAAC